MGVLASRTAASSSRVRWAHRPATNGPSYRAASYTAEGVGPPGTAPVACGKSYEVTRSHEVTRGHDPRNDTRTP